jgi:hypothetical protein
VAPDLSSRGSGQPAAVGIEAQETARTSKLGNHKLMVKKIGSFREITKVVNSLPG